jgi:hypothetical protein
VRLVNIKFQFNGISYYVVKYLISNGDLHRSNDSGLWKYFCRCAIFKSLGDNYEEGTKETKDTMCQRFCEKQMQLLTRVKESSPSASSTNFWKDKYLNMLMDDIRSLYAHKEIM